MGTLRGLAALGLAVLLASCSSSGTPSPSPSQADLTIRTGRAPNTSFQVVPADLGIHSFTAKPDVPTGSIRLTCFPNWRAVNPSKGEFAWNDMDGAVAQAEAWGYRDIFFSFCGTPQWAGTPATGPDVAAFGPGAAQPPKDMADWEEYVRQVAERYKGRVTGYEVWNEPSSPQFFTGTPAQMVEMTEIAYRTIKAADPSAYVLSGGVQTHRDDYYKGFTLPYLRGLQQKSWPIDGVSAHFYPDGGGGPVARVRQIERMQRDLATLAAPADLPLWDTEVNYELGLSGGEPDGRITGDRAAGWTAQTFLDSWRTGVRRTYWYLWTEDYYEFPGIQMRTGDPSATALSVLGAWVTGATFDGCTTDRTVVTCRFTQGDNDFRIAWSQNRPARLQIDGSVAVCPVTAAPCTNQSGSIRLTDVPVRID